MNKHLLVLLLLCCICFAFTRNYQQQKSSPIINPILEREIKAVCAGKYNNELPNCKKDPIVAVIFTEEDNQRYVYIIPLPFINKSKIKGCMNINGKLVVFYYEKMACIEGLLNVESMELTQSLDNYIEESDFMKGRDFDPVGIKLKVINSKNIKLVHKGMF